MYALVPLQTTYLEIFSCVCSDISNLAHRNSPKLAQIVRLTIWRVSRKSYIRIYRYALVPLQTTYLEIFSGVCSCISNLVHRNSPKLAQIIRLIAILLSGEFEENRILGFTDICLGTTPNHIFGDISCVCSDISNFAHRNAPKLAQIICFIAILLSGEFQENRILGSTDICLGIKYCTLVPTVWYRKSNSKIPEGLSTKLYQIARSKIKCFRK